MVMSLIWVRRVKLNVMNATVVARLNAIALVVWEKVQPMKIALLVAVKVFITVLSAMVLEK